MAAERERARKKRIIGAQRISRLHLRCTAGLTLPIREKVSFLSFKSQHPSLSIQRTGVGARMVTEDLWRSTNSSFFSQNLNKALEFSEASSRLMGCMSRIGGFLPFDFGDNVGHRVTLVRNPSKVHSPYPGPRNGTEWMAPFAR